MTLGAAALGLGWGSIAFGQTTVALQLTPSTLTPAPGSSVSVEVRAVRTGGAATANVQFRLAVAGANATGGGFVGTFPWFAFSTFGTCNSPYTCEHSSGGGIGGIGGGSEYYCGVA